MAESTSDFEIPNIGDFYEKGPRRYEVMDVIGSTVKIKGQFGAIITEPILKMIKEGYSISKSVAVSSVISA